MLFSYYYDYYFSELGAWLIHVFYFLYLVCVSCIFILHKFGLNHFIKLKKMCKLSVINNNNNKNIS